MRPSETAFAPVKLQIVYRRHGDRPAVRSLKRSGRTDDGPYPTRHQVSIGKCFGERDRIPGVARAPGRNLSYVLIDCAQRRPY